MLRIVCRNGFSHDLADMLLDNLRAAVAELNTETAGAARSGPSGFRH